MKKLALAIALTVSSSVALADMTMTNQGTMDHGNTMNSEGMSDVGMPVPGVKPTKIAYVMLSDDMKITFKEEIKIEPNDVVQFVVMNTGKINHEFSIGSEKEQLEHREMMRKMSSQQMHHSGNSGNSITVEPGKAEQLIWSFQGDKNIELACNIPGHAEAGMTKGIKL